jgi:immune inhibitor A
MVRRLVVVLAAALFAAVTAGPAAAMPPKEPAMMDALKQRGVITQGMAPGTAQIAYKLYMAKRFAGGPEERGNPLAMRAATQNESRGVARAQGQASESAGIMSDNVLVLLVEFAGGDEMSGGYRYGPLHNQMSQPTPDDNTTYWVPDFSASHYQEMLFDTDFASKSFSNYFMEQSGGTYRPTGDVSPYWVQVPHSEAWYGANASGGDDLNGPVWRVVQDAVANASGINWANYDVEDPYDIDTDGDYNESDGYVDHLMVIHAGAGEEAGGGAQGEDAIWSHSWWANYGTGGPGFGGVPTSDPNVFVGPYTIEPEDGTVGVFTHEFAHDLGLPDQYDTVYSGESSTGFWTLMSSGSWLGAPGTPLGTSPSALSAWEKWALGWADLDTVAYNAKASQHTIRSTSRRGTYGKALKVALPDKEVTVYVTDPRTNESGTFWYSGAGDNVDNTIARDVYVPAGDPTLRFWTWYDIESGYDYGYVQVTRSTNPGPNDWTTIRSSLSEDSMDGISGNSDGWVQASYDLSDYADEDVTIRLRYLTDGGVSLTGWAVDDISLGDWTDDGSSTEGWAVDGWSITSGYDLKEFPHYYIAEWRQPQGFDVSMKNWYNYPDSSAQAEFFDANPGMLVWYRNTEFADNWVGYHPWQGQLLLVDANPTLVTQPSPVPYYTSILPFRTRIQLRDAAFGKGPSKPAVITRWGVPVTFPGKNSVPVFDDTKMWIDPRFYPYFWYSSIYNNSISSVMTPGYGVKMTVKHDTPSEGVIRVEGRPMVRIVR